jgi:hypothetical protein
LLINARHHQAQELLSGMLLLCAGERSHKTKGAVRITRAIFAYTVP